MHEPPVAYDAGADVEVPVAVSTGAEAVDAVIAAVEQAIALPVAQHVAVYERAHEALRRALDAPEGA